MKKCIGWLIMLLLFITSNVFAQSPFLLPVDIDYGQPEKYLASGTQSTIAPQYVKELEQNIVINKRDISGVAQIFRWITGNFKMEHAGGKYIGRQTINDLFKTKVSTGCHDDGLIFSSILRHFGYPAIMVDATAIGWSDQKRSGHIFIEIYVDGQWILADSNSGEYIKDYNPGDPVIPITKRNGEDKGFYVMFKGVDPAGYGLKSEIPLVNMQRKLSHKIRKLSIEYPDYKILNFNETTFVLGNRAPVESFIGKFVHRGNRIYLYPAKGMGPNRFNSNNYGTLVYLKSPETNGTSNELTNIFAGLSNKNDQNYICIKKSGGKTLIYFKAESESLLLEMVQKFGDLFNLESLGDNEEKYISF